MLGTYIREIRKARNISLSQLSKKTNISKSYLSNIERNIQTNPSIGILTKISDALDADIQELIVASNASSQLTETNEWPMDVEKEWTRGQVEATEKVTCLSEKNLYY